MLESLNHHPLYSPFFAQCLRRHKRAKTAYSYVVQQPDSLIPIQLSGGNRGTDRGDPL